MSAVSMYDFGMLRELRKRKKMSLKDVSESSGVSIAVISKLERNQSSAEIETLYKIGRVFDMNPSELLALAENRSAQKRRSCAHRSGDFTFDEIRYGNVRCLYGRGKAGSRVSDPKIHQDDYEVCWVLKGKLLFHLPYENNVLEAGDAIQFDALFEHTYEALEDSEFIILHLRKGKRW